MARLLLVASLVGARGAAGLGAARTDSSMMQFGAAVDKSNASQQTTTVRVVYTEGTTPTTDNYGTIDVEAGVVYAVGFEILRNDLGDHGEYVLDVVIDGVSLGECHPDGSDYDCTFFECPFAEKVITASSSTITVNIRIQEHSWDCDCDVQTWECSSEDSVSGRTKMTAVGRFTLTAVPTPAPAPASATGDPHMQNIHGERFDLLKPGKHVLISIPRGVTADKTLLGVQADARQLGARCSDMYFTEINVTGKWTKSDLHYNAQVVHDETPQWSKFGPIELKVAHGHTEQGVTYLNFYVKHLGRAGFAVGGLLGEDDPGEAATPSAGCRKTVSLAKHLHGDGNAVRGASVATAMP
jgi:hypothetical protein